MTERELEQLGLGDAHLRRLALDALARARRELDPRTDPRALLLRVIADPGAHREDRIFGRLAQRLGSEPGEPTGPGGASAGG